PADSPRTPRTSAAQSLGTAARNRGRPPAPCGRAWGCAPRSPHPRSPRTASRGCRARPRTAPLFGDPSACRPRKVISTPADQPVGEGPARAEGAPAPRGPPGAGEGKSPPGAGQNGSLGGGDRWRGWRAGARPSEPASEGAALLEGG